MPLTDVNNPRLSYKFKKARYYFIKIDLKPQFKPEEMQKIRAFYVY